MKLCCTSWDPNILHCSWCGNISYFTNPLDNNKYKLYTYIKANGSFYLLIWGQKTTSFLCPGTLIKFKAITKTNAKCRSVANYSWEDHKNEQENLKTFVYCTSLFPDFFSYFLKSKSSTTMEIDCSYTLGMSSRDSGLDVVIMIALQALCSNKSTI